MPIVASNSRACSLLPLALLGLLATSSLGAQQSAAPAPQPAGPPAPAGGVLAEQVIAVVNGDLILESDIDEERRFQAFQPLRDAGSTFSRQAAVERLVDRALILQQARLQPDGAVTLADARAQLQTMQADIPACKQFHCETPAGWQKFVASEGFTIPTLEDRWRERMQILRFIEVRFRSGIRVTPAEIKTYYDDTLLPQFRNQKATAPAIETVSDRIEEILLQKQVSNLLLDWLQSLKAQGTVRFIKTDEVKP
jgi:peptidyl-prolyl cis-trans isomerase SurA